MKEARKKYKIESLKIGREGLRRGKRSGGVGVVTRRR